MKKRFFVLLLLTIFVTSIHSVSVIHRQVPLSEALEIAKDQFPGADYDYYQLQTQSTEYWTIFVDAEPMRGWNHDCYLLQIPKSTSAFTSPTTPPIAPVISQTMSPPIGSYTPLDVKDRYGANANSKPVVLKASSANADTDVAGRTYAIILSGGIQPMSNHERYWNDCSFIYQTLVNKYFIPRNNIFPIMSDGTNPAADMHTVANTYVSQPLDLDFDGLNDIQLAANKSNVNTVLNQLIPKLERDDHLFLYVIDHGGSNDYVSKSYICLWNGGKLYDTELAEMLLPFTNKGVNVNVVLGQCFAGGFVEELTQTGCVVSAASTGSESSWGCTDIPYDEFVYQWTSAVNMANHKGVAVSSDSDGNGRVTMDEAFTYAKSNDRVTKEHPQYLSTPLSVGEDLAFNHIAPSIDLYVKDNDEDTGKEPNLTTDKFWISPSIWVRNQDDWIYEHENPEYSTDHQQAFVYVRVYNRGKEAYTGGKYIHVYWAQASTGLTTKVWKGREVYNNDNPTGGHLDGYPIKKTIHPGEYHDFKLGWSLPSLLEDYPEGNFHFCLMAKIMDTSYDDGYVEGKSYFDVKNNNDQCQKNITIIRKEDVNKEFNIYVRNISSLTKAYTLELKPRSSQDEDIYSKSRIELEMSSKIYDAWGRGGFNAQYVMPSILDDNFVPQKVQFYSPQSKLNFITLNSNEFDIVKVRFNFLHSSHHSQSYTMDLIQRDEEGNIVGGETFIVESPVIASQPINIVSEASEDGNTLLSVEGADFNAIAWTNQQGDELGDTKTITVSPSYESNKYTVKALTDKGELVMDSISLQAKDHIKSVVLSSRSSNMQVELNRNAPQGAYISVASVINGENRITSNIPAGENTITIDMPTTTKGLHVVCYSINGKVVDKKKVILQ